MKKIVLAALLAVTTLNVAHAERWDLLTQAEIQNVPLTTLQEACAGYFLSHHQVSTELGDAEKNPVGKQGYDRIVAANEYMDEKLIELYTRQAYRDFNYPDGDHWSKQFKLCANTY